MEDDDIVDKVNEERENQETRHENNGQSLKENQVPQGVTEEIIELDDETDSDDEEGNEVEQILSRNQNRISNFEKPIEKNQTLRCVNSEKVINEFEEDEIKIDYINLESPEMENKNKEPTEAILVTPIRIVVNSEMDISNSANLRYRSRKSECGTLTDVRRANGFVRGLGNKDKAEGNSDRKRRKGQGGEPLRLQYAKEDVLKVEYDVLEERNFMEDEVIEGKFLTSWKMM